MSGEAWFTLAIAVLTIALLAAERLPPAVVIGGAVTVLAVAGIIDNAKALTGFSNEAPITVAALYVLAAAVEATGAFNQLTERALGRSLGPEEDRSARRRQLARISYPAMALSAFIANTPLVSMLAPRVLAWSRRTGRSPARYLMPLSYAVIFGGCITLIGTSTNLVVSGLLEESGQERLHLFEITSTGLPIALVGVTLLVLLGPRLMPDRQTPSESLDEETRQFTVEMIVTDVPVSGRTVSDAGLRNLQGVFLIEVERDGVVISPVTPQEVLAIGDRLTFAGNVSRILDLQRMPGLASAEERHFSVVANQPDRQFFEAVVSRDSPLEGSTLKMAGFRRSFGAAVLAIYRAGERVGGKLGEVPLLAGDVLLVLGGRDFAADWRQQRDFALVAPLSGTRPLRREKARVVEALTVVLIVVAGTGLLDLLQVSLLVAIGLIAFKVITPAEAGRAIDVNVILVMAAGFGLGIAIEDSGLADRLARLVVGLFDPLGDIGVLAGILIATMLMTELLSNNAAAVLMFPIAMATAQQAGLDPRPFAVVILFGATLSFLTPIGYQTNTLVWSMGGYRYSDFARLGAPLTLATLIVTIAVVPLAFPL
ncbi:MAG: SLC13 family permease [Actinomycetota bacterium]|nr:SLC13 family permease [Actinomycetota bacterium]MDQ3640148.1 SLC13 family permease [Actinomycetota bacterium]